MADTRVLGTWIYRVSLITAGQTKSIKVLPVGSANG